MQKKIGRRKKYKVEHNGRSNALLTCLYVGTLFTSAVPLFANAQDIRTGVFELSANINSAYDLYCSGSNTQGGCAPNPIQFGQAGLDNIQEAPYPVYLWATLGANSSSPDLTYTITDGVATRSGVSCNDEGLSNCFPLTAISGTDTDVLPIRVAYTGCGTGSPTNVYVPGSGYKSLEYNQTGFPTCSNLSLTSPNQQTTPPSTNTMGYFTFTIPQQNSLPVAGEYSGTLTITVCTTGAC